MFVLNPNIKFEKDRIEKIESNVLQMNETNAIRRRGTFVLGQKYKKSISIPSKAEPTCYSIVSKILND